MSKKETLQQEVARRQDALQTMREATAELQTAKQQFFQLDQENAATQQESRQSLESVYKESRHYTGKQPRVYTEAEVTTYPFFQGQADDAGNPFFKLSAIKAGDLGLTPLNIPPTDTNGRWTREKTYTPTEDVPRTPALTALQAYPDHSGEPLPNNFPGAQDSTPAYCDGASGSNQTQCETNGGTWIPSSPIPDPVWVPSETAPEVLKSKLIPWKRKLEQLVADTYLNDSATVNLYQQIINEIDNCISLLPAPAVFVRNTGNPNPVTWGQTPDASGLLLTSINILIQYAQTDMPNFINNTRKPFLQQEATKFESQFYTFASMRLHQANGSFSKYRAALNQENVNADLIKDHERVIAELLSIIQTL